MQWFVNDSLMVCISADPSRRVVAIILCKIQTFRKIQNPKSKIQNPKSKIQNPKSKIQNPKSKIQDPKSEIKNPKSKIQNPRSKIQNPESKIQNPRSKIQNPNPKSKRPRLGLPQEERILRQSKIQNPKSEIQNPKSKIQDPKSKIQNPRSKIQNPKSKIQSPKSKIQNPKSKIQNPKSKIQNPKSKLQTPNSKLQNPNGPFGWPGWGGYVANALVWMGWPPKFGIVGRDPSLQAKGRRLDCPRARLKLGPDFQMVVLLETEHRFPVLCRGNWGPISRKMVAGCGVPSNYSMGSTSWTRAGKGNKIGCRSLLLLCSLITGWNCGCFWFLFTGRMVNKKRCEKLLQWETIFDAGASTCAVTPTDLLLLHHLLRCTGSGSAADRR